MKPSVNGRIVSIQVGRPTELQSTGASDAHTVAWTSGIYKHAIAGRIHLGRLNLDGDGQADLVSHGGSDRAILLYDGLRYPEWSREIGIPNLPFGAFGENLTVEGLSEQSVCLGDVYQVGEVAIEISQPRLPCWKLARRNGIPDLADRVLKRGWTGWYARVLQTGWLETGMELELLERRCPEWTIEQAHQAHAGRKQNPAAAQRLAACTQLSELWRTFLST